MPPTAGVSSPVLGSADFTEDLAICLGAAAGAMWRGEESVATRAAPPLLFARPGSVGALSLTYTKVHSVPSSET